MIILGKDKVDERYNISDDGTITDLQGNVQKTKIIRGRPFFKSQYVHRILMWTKFGYKDLDIHHLDKNKLNNNINNLVFLTRAEHTKLHHTGKNNPMYGKHFKHSKETKKKMSDSLKGRQFSEEHKKKISNAKKGKFLSKEHKKKISESIKKYWKKNIRL